MGRSSKTEPANDERTTSTPPASAPARTSYQPQSPAPSGQALTESETMARDIKEGRLSGFVGSGTTLTGETNFQAMLRIDGHLTGSVTSSDGTLIIGSTGQVDANIRVAAAVINGTVNGDIIATERLELGRSARVAGNIQTPRLMIEDGAILEGSCSMLKAQENLEKQKAESERRVVAEKAEKEVSTTVIDRPEKNSKPEKLDASEEKSAEAALAS